MRALFNILFNLLLKRSIFHSSHSSVAISTSLTWGTYDHEDQQNAMLLCERNPHSHKDLVTLVKVKVWVGVELSTSILPSQDNDPMVKRIEGEALSEVPPETRPEEVVSLLEEVPGMVKLDTVELRKLMRLIFGAESIVECGCYKDGSHADGASDELVVFAGDGGQVGRVKSRHGVVRKGEGRRREVLSMLGEHICWQTRLPRRSAPSPHQTVGRTLSFPRHPPSCIRFPPARSSECGRVEC